MIGFYNYTVILTYIGLASSVLGIFTSFDRRPTMAVICLIIAGICDMFDGKIARTMDRTLMEKRFGIQIDSLCDLVSFGVLPAAIGYSLTGYKLSVILVYTMYILAAVIRLAYYNVTEEIRQDNEAGEREYYEGLPVTNITIIVPILFIFKRFIDEVTFANVYVIILFIVGCAFVTGFKVKKHPFASKNKSSNQDNEETKLSKRAN